ncbi:hypothetical protein O181_029313 [Austropuccinia psidii MF-1]|uniref:Uncharacterized protein n=1 Tax=Austropuccinia psidii MF-1 TaxID=1389203 RepID=A0A9Q3CVG8_9BASI|nr:hypothetical protein [Austropuccinia psidii MF-1]
MNTRSQGNQAVITPTARAPLDHTPSVYKMNENIDIGPPMEGETHSRKSGTRSRLREAEDEEGEESVEEERSEETEVAAALAGVPEASEAPNISLSNQPLVSQAEPNILKMMEQMNEEVSPKDKSRSPEFKNPSMEAPDSFDGMQDHKLRGFIQSFQLIFHNEPENPFYERKKILCSTSFITGRA